MKEVLNTNLRHCRLESATKDPQFARLCRSAGYKHLGLDHQSLMEARLTQNPTALSVHTAPTDAPRWPPRTFVLLPGRQTKFATKDQAAVQVSAISRPSYLADR